MTRDEWLPRLRDVFGRVVRWANPIGGYDGCARTLEVFNADALEQRELLRHFRGVRSEVEGAVGGPVIVLFHTTKETARLYANVDARDLEKHHK
jgi:hypothetical protein